jgi:abortive infection bacteriophage resistance protein
VETNSSTEKLLYTKGWKSLDEQLNLMISRGLLLGDYPREKALNKLHFIGYYRLSGYSYSFKKSIDSDQFAENTYFSDIIELYKFDRNLRLLIIDAIERIEIALRSSLSYELGKIDPFILETDDRYESLRDVIEEVISTSKEDFCEHFRSKYQRPYPIWMLLNIIDFGTLIKVYANSDPNIKAKIAYKFGVHSTTVFFSWINSIKFVRNKCAHHARLWNTHILRIPRVPKNKPQYKWIKGLDFNKRPEAKLWFTLKIIEFMLSTLKASTNWSNKLENLLSEFPKLKSNKSPTVENMKYIIEDS